MTALVTESRFADPDLAYRALIEAHRGLSDEDSAALNSCLVLILANHIGDHAVVGEAVALAKRSMGRTEEGSPPPTSRL
ncbi:MAG TPA: DUF2783 domain-containing protein [Microvirga sp.]|jgi:hypothetical protein|nr:DUF2783 domain-containing protein [Microvirga sp.]